MIYLITATPGAGKTNYALDLITKMRRADPARALYVSNLRKPRHDLIGAEPLEHVRDWESLPDGSIVFIDEIQEQIPQRDKSAQAPAWVKMLAKHRHRGFDFVFTTLDASLIDVMVRRFVGEHIYLRRKARALSFFTGFRAGALAIKWDKYQPKPDDFFAQRKAVKSGYSYNLKAFDWYESTTKDTHKPKVPWQVFALIVGIVFVGWLFMRGISRFTSKGDELAPASAVAPSTEQGREPAATALEAGQEWLDRFKPRVRGIPASAPAYDYLAPTVNPKVYCAIGHPGEDAQGVYRGRSCRCYSEQGTPIDADMQFCESTAMHGIYDPFKADGGGTRGGGESSPPDALVEGVEAGTERAGGLIGGLLGGGKG